MEVLAGYIFGGNDENQQIAMTSPVRMSGKEKLNTMSFVLPSEMEFEIQVEIIDFKPEAFQKKRAGK